jgi:hypothetical protein
MYRNSNGHLGGGGIHHQNGTSSSLDGEPGRDGTRFADCDWRRGTGFLGAASLRNGSLPGRNTQSAILQTISRAERQRLLDDRTRRLAASMQSGFSSPSRSSRQGTATKEPQRRCSHLSRPGARSLPGERRAPRLPPSLTRHSRQVRHEHPEPGHVLTARRAILGHTERRFA